MKTIITIGREFGSGGRELGRLLAERLDVAYYDHEIVTELVNRTELAESYIKQIEERHIFPMFPITTGRTFWPRSNPIVDQQLSVYLEESKIIREMAEKSDCVIVGRCGDHVLRDFAPFRLFFYADTSFRLARCRSRADPQENMCDRDILQHIDSIDRSRARYYKFFTEHKWGDRRNYDLCVNTASVEWEKLVEMLANIL